MKMRLRIACLLLAPLFFVGCEDDSPTQQPTPDNSPNILHFGPDLGETVEAIWGRLDDAAIYAQFGDPQGFDDLSTAVFSIEDIRIRSVVGRDYLRPGGNICNDSGADYASVLPYDLASMLPESLGGLAATPVDHTEGFIDVSGLLCFSEWCETFLVADLLTTEAEAFGPSVEGGCTTGMALIGVYPPLQDPAQDIIITRIELEFVNVELTIFDAAGESETAGWPSFRVLYTHPAERE
jgi:hypothetical protein